MLGWKDGRFTETRAEEQDREGEEDAEMCSCSEEGSYLRLIDLCITQDKEEEGEEKTWRRQRSRALALRTSIKSQFLIILSIFGDKCPQNGSKNIPKWLQERPKWLQERRCVDLN